MNTVWICSFLFHVEFWWVVLVNFHFSFYFLTLLCPLVPSALVSEASLETSFTLPQDDVDHSTKDGQWEGHPGQDVRKAKGHICVGMPFFMSHCEDGSTAHHTEASKDLENASKVEPSTLCESEQLAEEQEQRQHTEDDGQDHQSLDRLQPFICG